MKFFHLSDLHLGKRLNEFSLLEDQSYMLQQILDWVAREIPDAVLIAGDVYDKSVPSAEAVQLFDQFLWGLSQAKTQVFVISGNHDSPERIAFGGRLMDRSGIHMAPVYDGTVASVTLADSWGEVDVWMLPFIKPAHVRRFFPETPMESYTDALQTVLDAMERQEGRRNVLITHQFVTGAEQSESETVSVGGADNVDAAVFEGFDYVALGHIHRPQHMGRPTVRYCGTPLKYSFSEANQEKSITVVELEENVTVRCIPLTPLREVREVRGTFHDLLSQSAVSEDYLRVILTDEEDVPDALGQLRTVFPNLMKLSYDNTRTRSNEAITAAEDVERRSPLELFAELYEKQNNQPMSDLQRSFTQSLIESIGEDFL